MKFYYKIFIILNMEIEAKIPNILVTGTPGTGKTTLSRLLSEYVD